MNRPDSLAFLRACAVLLLALAGLCPGQDEKESRDTARPLSARDPLPELPVNGLLDEGNIFPAREEVLLVADIEDFRTRLGLPLFVVTANYVFGDTVENYGDRLVKEGLKDRTGVLILYERGSGQIHYSATPGALGRAEDMRNLFLAASKAAAFLPDEANTAQRLRAAVQALTTAAAQWKQTGVLPPLNGEPSKVPSTPASPEKLPDAPENFVMDDGDFFDPAAEASLKAELVKFHADCDMDLYVITSVYLPGRTAQVQAEKLAEKWLSNRYGVVVVVNRGTAVGESSLGLAPAASVERIIPGKTMVETLERARARDEEARNRPDGSAAAGVYAAVRVFMEVLAKRGGASRAAQEQATSRGQWSVMTGVAAAMLAGAVLLFAFHRVQERLETRSNEQFRFPDVTVGRRLGATQGGGNVAGISFGRKS